MALPGLKISEADVTSAVRGYLEHKGWRAVRMQRTVVPGQFSTCEPGTPDLQFIRYIESDRLPAIALVLWVEMKAKGARARCRCLTKKARQRCTACDQRAWRERERSRGAVVWSQVDSIDWVTREYERCFSWLHSGDTGRGQLELVLGQKL